MTIKILGLSRKMKNKIKEHGEIWNVLGRLTNGCTEYQLGTIKSIHHGKYPYQVWAKLDVDFKIIEEIQ